MCNNNNEEEYYQSMQENLNDMEEALDNGVATDADIEDFVNRMTIQTYDFNYCLDLPLYRARFDNGFDNTDPHQFGYIHNLAAITRYRYNKAQEAVLYTATEPSTAYKEIENSRNGETHFYLSTWSHVAGTREFHTALNVNCVGLTRHTTAERFYNILRDNVGPGTSKLYYLSSLGRILEKPGTDYRFSSILASRIFQTHDALITTSMKSNGSELNITFNQSAADQLLELKWIYRCEVLANQASVFHVSNVGIPNGGIIDWYNWLVDVNSISLNGQTNMPVDIHVLRQAIQTNAGITQSVLYPNVNKEPTGLHDGIVVYNGENVRVRFRIQLI